MNSIGNPISMVGLSGLSLGLGLVLDFKVNQVSAIDNSANSQIIASLISSDTSSTTSSSKVAQNKSFLSTILTFLTHIWDLVSGQKPVSNGYVPTCGTFNCEPCGVTYNQPNVKIVGGVPAVPHSWPAQVFVYFQYVDNYTLSTGEVINVATAFRCGGTLINPDTVLTAAHCINTEVEAADFEGNIHKIPVPINGKYYTVWLGYQNLLNNSDGYGIQVPVSKVTVNPGFNTSQSLLNDLAILKLNQQVTLNEAIQVACLPNESQVGYPTQYGDPVYLSGWGTTSSGGETSNVLLNVQLTLYNFSLCTPVLSYIPQNPQTQLCAGDYAGGKDSCQGDSGGGLYIQDYVNGELKFIDVGIVSYGNGCALPKSPGFYTRVSAFVGWINQTVFDSL